MKDETFTLFEAVGALEVRSCHTRNKHAGQDDANENMELIKIMDSKMDSGYIAPGENQAQALEDDYDVRRELTPEEVVGLMDQLLCHEVCAPFHMDFGGADGCLDGMAYGPSAFTNPLHIYLP